MKAEIGRQLMVSVENNIGALAEITNLCSDAQINFVALCGYSIENKAAIMFVTEDNNAAKELLQKNDFNVQEEEVILLSVPNKPGMLEVFARKIAEAGFDLKLIYGSVEQESDSSRIVIISDNIMDVMLLIKTELERS